MASSLSKMVFGKKQQPQPLQQYDQEDLEAGRFLPETQNVYANVDVGAPKPGAGQYTDEYRA